MTLNRFARSGGDGDISGDDAPRLWSALQGMTLFGLFFAFLLTADLILRHASHNADLTRPSPTKSEELRPVAVGKSDRLLLFTPVVPASPSADDFGQPTATASAAPPAPLAAATDDDIKQAEAEHHRRRDICPKGRTYYLKGRYQYWRCNR